MVLDVGCEIKQQNIALHKKQNIISMFWIHDVKFT